MTDSAHHTSANDHTQGPTCARCSYVLITPARNEAAFIELTLKSVIAQTLPPLKWVIVSDGSTDQTDEIVRRYCGKYGWIELISMPVRQERHFAGKVNAFRAGYARVSDLPFDVVGNLDGDVSFAPGYFDFLMRKFAENAKLGVGGTPFTEGDRQYDYRFTNIEHVSGQAQMFRRACFEEIGGYVPAELGGIDLVAVIKARMKGWETRSFPEMSYVHHRKMGSTHHTGFRERLHRGKMDYLLGSHPLWELGRSVFQMKNKPYVIGGFLIAYGYIKTMLTHKMTVSEDLMRFRRAEQMRQLKTIVARACRFSRSNSQH